MYGSFGLTALLERRCQERCFPRELLLLLLIFSISLLMEVLQATVVATRAAEWFDLAANFLGLAGAWLTYSLLRRFIL